MDWIVLEGVKPYDGRYELDAQREFSTREWGWIKRLAGYLPLTVEEAFAGVDPEFFAVLALIALHRAGRVEAGEVPALYERMLDQPFMTTIRLETDGEPREADVGPPARSSPGSSAFSGDASPTNSGTSPSPPNGSGIPASDSSLSDQVTWQT